jgi:exopolyphosphatase/guanosine-5'-triphosphate,3'-diphosphate pyrophosphatase
MRSLGVERYRAVATSASRDAANGGVLKQMLADNGVEIEIVAGSEEASLSFLGATFGRFGEDMLVVDCGGGSTELVFGDSIEGGGSRVRASRSVDVGSRRMTDMFLHSDPPTAEELHAARAWASAELRAYFDRLEERPRCMVSVAGTATTLVAIKLGLDPYDPKVVDGHVVSGSEVSDIFEMLAGMTLAERLEVKGLHPGRAPVIVAGALIIETCLALAGLDSTVVSERDILYGILLDAYRDLQKAT